MSYLFYAEFELGELVYYSGSVFKIGAIYITVEDGVVHKDYILKDLLGYDIPYPVDEPNLKRVIPIK